MTLLPSIPWQAEQTSVTMFLAFSVSPQGPATEEQAQHAAT